MISIKQNTGLTIEWKESARLSKSAIVNLKSKILEAHNISSVVPGFTVAFKIFVERGVTNE